MGSDAQGLPQPVVRASPVTVDVIKLGFPINEGAAIDLLCSITQRPTPRRITTATRFSVPLRYLCGAMRVGRRLATAIAVLLWIPAALADAVERVFAPSNEGQCQEAWDRNTRTADRLGQETNDCRLDCANRAIASYGTSAYSNVCGGEIPNLDPIAIAGYERCRPLQRRHDDFMHAKKEAYDDCVQAVHNVQAAQTVYRASRDNTKYPDELSPGRTAADEAGDQVSTGNPVVDRYRREASDGAANATSSLSSKALEDLSNAVDGNPTQSKSAYSRCREVPIDKRQDCLYRNLRQQGDPND